MKLLKSFFYSKEFKAPAFDGIQMFLRRLHKKSNSLNYRLQRSPSGNTRKMEQTAGSKSPRQSLHERQMKHERERESISASHVDRAFRSSKSVISSFSLFLIILEGSFPRLRVFKCELPTNQKSPFTAL